jgi:thiamine-phosphate pyrophosphorylase
LRSKRFAAGLPPLLPALKPPIICYVTDRKSLAEGGTGVLGRIRAAIAAGVDWVQIREKDLSGRELLGLAREAVAAGGGARVIVNDRVDVALAAEAAGVHLGRESLGARDVVRWCSGGGGNAPADFVVGLSCHSLAEAREAESAGAAYIFFGPIFDTPSKRGMGEPQGVARLEEICRGVAIPVLAIGGVSEENAADCIRAGAAGIAAIRMFQDVRDVAARKHMMERLRGPR